MKIKITIFGAGYVGLVSATCFAELGHDVICVDIDQEKIALLQQGKSTIYEPGLEDMLQRTTQSGRLLFTTDTIDAVRKSEYLMIAVGTPADTDGSADLRYVLAVAKTIGKSMERNSMVIIKSTVPVGTANKVKEVIAQELQARNYNTHFSVVSNPEFLKEGHAIRDFMEPDRMIVGCETSSDLEKINALYKPIIDKKYPLLSMSITSAELTKYAANAFLATKISFMNAMSQLAESAGADIEDIRLGIGSDSRINIKFLHAGCGYGGACFPKDVRALKKLAEQYNTDHDILSAVDNINVQQKKILIKKIQHFFQNDLKNKTVALWGLAYKPNTNDMREAPSRALMESLWEQGAKVQAYDPVAILEAEKIYGKRANLQFCKSASAALESADALVVVTEWQEFREPNFKLIKEKLRYPVIFDGRNLYNPKLLKEQGFVYYGVGRGERIQ